MRRRWRNENVEFVRDDARFKLLAKEHGKAKAARIRIAEMMAEEAERLGDLEGAARVRAQVERLFSEGADWHGAVE
jgi:ribosome maturation protein Sdo1